MGGPDRSGEEGPPPRSRQLDGHHLTSRPIAALSKLSTRLRARGLGEIASVGGARVREAISSHEILVVLARSTVEPTPPPADSTLRLVRLGPADGSRYAHDIGTDSRATFAARLSDASRCYAVEDAGRLLHASWVSTECTWTRELRAYLCPAGGHAYVYESFTRADARGRGVYPFALNEISRDLAERGIDLLWVGVEAHNAPSLRAVAKAGFRPAFEISYGRRLGRLRMDVPDEVKTDRRAAGWLKKGRIWLSGDGAAGQSKP